MRIWIAVAALTIVAAMGACGSQQESPQPSTSTEAVDHAPEEAPTDVSTPTKVPDPAYPVSLAKKITGCDLAGQALGEQRFHPDWYVANCVLDYSAVDIYTFSNTSVESALGELAGPGYTIAGEDFVIRLFDQGDDPDGQRHDLATATHIDQARAEEIAAMVGGTLLP